MHNCPYSRTFKTHQTVILLNPNIFNHKDQQNNQRNQNEAIHILNRYRQHRSLGYFKLQNTQ